MGVPMGVVSKKDNGDRRIPRKADLNIRRLATKPPALQYNVNDIRERYSG